MPVHDNLGKRMKGYESVSKNVLMKRTPVAIRIDGKAFHTFTKGMLKPFDATLNFAMVRTMEYLCTNIQGCVFGYTQSDEITLILIDYQTLETSAWFDYEVQKICSIVSSMATLAFDRAFNYSFELGVQDNFSFNSVEDEKKLFEVYQKASERGAFFDARCFNISKEEVCNLIYWRQLDAMRNSALSVGQANFSHKELQNKSCEQIKEMLKADESLKNWEDYPISLQRGTACYKEDGEWITNHTMPILKGEDRNFVEKHIFVGK